jgi:hypothetical protein
LVGTHGKYDDRDAERQRICERAGTAVADDGAASAEQWSPRDNEAITRTTPS